MICKIKKEVLQKILKKIDSLAFDKSTNPNYGSIFVDIKEKYIDFLFVNSSFKYIYQLKDSFNTDEEFKFILNIDLFKNVIDKLNNDKLEICKNLDDNIQINSGSFSCTLNTLVIENYPIFDIKYNDDNEIELKEKEFDSIIKCVLPFVNNNNPQNKAITGVNFYFDSTNKQMEFKSTDSIRGVKLTFPTQSKLDFDFSLPSKNLSILKSNFINEKIKNIKLCKQDNSIIFKLENELILIKTIEGSFPNLERIFSLETNIIYSIVRKELIEAIDRVISLNINDTSTLTLQFNNNELILSSESYTFGWSNEKVKINSNNPINITLKINGQYLLQLLKTIDSNNITFNIKDNSSPILISSNQKELLQIICPIRS